jgi:hypothetical protein
MAEAHRNRHSSGMRRRYPRRAVAVTFRLEAISRDGCHLPLHPWHPVPTATFRVLYVFFVLSKDRRRLLHFNVTEHPGATCTAQQIVEAFPQTGPCPNCTNTSVGAHHSGATDVTGTSCSCPPVHGRASSLTPARSRARVTVRCTAACPQVGFDPPRTRGYPAT